MLLFNFAPFPIFWGVGGNQTDLETKQILTHGEGSLLTVVAQRQAWGESSGSVHSSGTAVRRGPFPLSQIYKATCSDTDQSGEVHELNTRCDRVYTLSLY